MSAIRATSRRNPCPVCNGVKSDCRTTDRGNVLCHTYIELHKGESVGDWVWVHNTDDIWGLFVPKNSYKYPCRQTFVERSHTTSSADEVKQAMYALNADIFDRIYRLLRNEFSLALEHRDYLRRKGLPDSTIDAMLVFSIVPKEPIATAIPYGFPGVRQTFRGDTVFAVGQDGIAVPFFNIDGKIWGFQIRFPDGYRWAKAEFSSKIVVGGRLELPLTFRDNEAEKLALVEGPIKAFRASERIKDYDILGAAGGQFAASEGQVAKILWQKAYREILLVPDGGDIGNQSVMRRWRRQIEFLRRLGVKAISVAWWGQRTKGGTDIDEISDGDLKKIRKIQLSTFYRLADKITEKETLRTSGFILQA